MINDAYTVIERKMVAVQNVITVEATCPAPQVVKRIEWNIRKLIALMNSAHLACTELMEIIPDDYPKH